MKKILTLTTAIVLAAALFALSACDNNGGGNNDPQCLCPAGTTHEPNETCCTGTDCKCPEAVAATHNSPAVPMFADKTAAIKTDDTFTDKQWNAIVDAIAAKFKAAYDSPTTPAIPQIYENTFVLNITIIVEKNPQGYTNYKVTGRTLYVRADAVDNLNTDTIVLAIINNETYIDGVKQ